MNFWYFLSQLGGLVMCAQVGIAISVWLLIGKSWRLSLAWLVLFCGGMAVVVVTKLAFYGWGIGIQALDFCGISGHSMRAAAVFPVAFYLIFRPGGVQVRNAGLAAGVLLAVLIAVSRVKIQAHTTSEAISGCLLGLAVAGAFIFAASREDQPALSRVLAVLCFPFLMLSPHTAQVQSTEGWIAQLAVVLSGHDRPYVRGYWRLPQAWLNMVR